MAAQMSASTTCIRDTKIKNSDNAFFSFIFVFAVKKMCVDKHTDKTNEKTLTLKLKHIYIWVQARVQDKIKPVMWV